MSFAIAPAEVDFSDPASPASPLYGDVYHARAGALAQARHVFLGGSGLPGRWQGRDRFVVLETGFGLGNNFLATWDAWQQDPQRCGRLVFVSVEKHPLRREDLARAALVEKKKAADMAEQLKAEIAVLDDALRAYEVDIEKLQNRLREARSRQNAIAARLESAENRVKLRTLLASERVDEAMARFDQLERRVDYAEGRADALGLADQSSKPSLADEIAALAGQDKIDEELEAMKRALKGDDKQED